MREVWQTGFGKEFGSIVQGDKKTGTKQTNAILLITHDASDCTPEYKVVTYVRIIINFRPQKEDPSRVCITYEGNMIKTPGNLTTRAAKPMHIQDPVK